MFKNRKRAVSFFIALLHVVLYGAYFLSTVVALLMSGVLAMGFWLVITLPLWKAMERLVWFIEEKLE